MTASRRFGVGNISFKKQVAQGILRTLISAFLALLIYFSVVALAAGFTYKPAGYEVLYSEDGQSFETVYTYMYTGKESPDWVDPNLKKYLEQDNYFKQEIPKPLDEGIRVTIAWISQGCAMLVWGMLVYKLNWNVGNSAADKNELGGVALDRLRGIKAGLMADIPFIASYLFLVFARLTGLGASAAVSAFKILNYGCFAFNDMIITDGIASISYGELACLALVLLPLPLFAAFGYKMGLRHLIISEKVMYKNDEEEQAPSTPLK